MDFPQSVLVPPPILSTFSRECVGQALIGGAFTVLDATTSRAWTANNKAYYYPFTLYAHCTAYQLLFMVGSTSSGNIDVGIYDNEANLIVGAGSTAMSASTSTVQQINITDTALKPGRYFLGVACSTTAGTCFNGGSSSNDEQILPLLPVYEQASALPLPSTATPVLCTDAAPPIWVCGIQFVPTF